MADKQDLCFFSFSFVFSLWGLSTLVSSPKLPRTRTAIINGRTQLTETLHCFQRQRCQINYLFDPQPTRPDRSVRSLGRQCEQMQRRRAFIAQPPLSPTHPRYCVIIPAQWKILDLQAAQMPGIGAIEVLFVYFRNRAWHLPRPVRLIFLFVYNKQVYKQFHNVLRLFYVLILLSVLNILNLARNIDTIKD